jgi:hypothetical protein
MSNRTSRALTVCAMAVVLAGCRPTTTTTSPAPAVGQIGGDYSVIYSAPTTVHITSSSSGLYTMTAKTALTLVTGAKCSLPAGTALATFSGTPPNFTGQHGWFNYSTCVRASTVNLKVTLNVDGSLTMRLDSGETLVLTKL